ncbi:hypothetical protein OMDBNIEC_00051 [Salmonella phage STP-SP5]|nr:hypothetical protein OMDBNIEC_00051 [Salmonella phage STP-SP5]
MATKYSTVKCTKATGTAFVAGQTYRMCHAWHDDVIETGNGRSFGITANLEHNTSEGYYAFELVGNYNGD